MTPDQYLQSLLTQIKAPVGTASPAQRVANELCPVIRAWAGNQLREITYSGSYAKGTAIRGGTDVDLFISLESDTSGTLKDLYWSLHTYLKSRGYAPRAQNVSIGVTTGSGDKVDLVPGRKQAGNTTDHSLYRRKADTWTQTNVTTHIATVIQSRRVDEVCLLKLWRQVHSMDFPSFYLELTVINALSGRGTGQLAGNVLTALRYIAEKLPTARVVDPANTNNIISDDLTDSEKRAISAQAVADLRRATWEEILQHQPAYRYRVL